MIHFEDTTLISVEAFKRQCEASGVKTSVSDLWNSLRECGAVEAQQPVFRHEGQVVRRQYWSVTPDALFLGGK